MVENYYRMFRGKAKRGKGVNQGGTAVGKWKGG